MADCKTCKEKRRSLEPVPLIVHESAMARQERTIKRLLGLLILVISLLVVTNGAWLWWESQFEYEITETYTSESDDGGIAIVNRDGEVNYGEGHLYPYEKENP